MVEEKELSELRDRLEELSKFRGRHTELITVYIPAGHNINNIVDQLTAEASTAENIKSKTTKTNVISAIESIIRYIKMNRILPANGLGLFAGNISKVEGQPDFKLWAISPPQPMNVKYYRCDQTFMLDPLTEMLQAKEVWGLITIDRKEATFGILEGKQIKILRHLTSGVPGKVRAGGQCLDKETLILTNDGDIVKIKNLDNSIRVSSCEIEKQKISFSDITNKWQDRKNLFQIITKYPKIKINASADHTFFVRTENGIEEKPLSKIKKGDYLIMPEKIELNNKDQKINFEPKIKRKDGMKKVKIPKKITGDLAKLLGYYLGDGSYETDRLTFFEQRKGVAEDYKKLIERIFEIESKLSFRKEKNYYQIRVYSRIITQLFKSIFQESAKTLNEKIPSIILKSSNNSLASFISGFFDAEGYVSGSRIGLGINNETIIKQLQFSLLRFGILSSVLEYNNKRNPYSKKIRYTIVIDDTESIKNFAEYINFTSKEKNEKLSKILTQKKDKSNVRQILVNGKEIREVFRKYNYPVHSFGLSGFFSNKRQLNKTLFRKRLVDNIKNPELKKILNKYYNSELIPVKIQYINQIGSRETIDIETSSNNFIANGILVHNSAARFERLTEGYVKEFYRRVSDSAKELFFDMPKMRGIFLGGPGSTKEEWLKEGQLATQLREKIKALKDIGYVDEQGIEMLVEACKEELEKEDIIKEKKILEKFFLALAKTPEKTAHTLEKIETALEHGAVDLLIISTSFDKQKAKELEEKATSISAETVYISTETAEGVQFKNISGIGVILRFSIG